jgi:hypothetical protein
MLHNNDIGRSPAGRGERGVDTDDEDENEEDFSDGEGGEIPPGPLRDAMIKQRTRQRNAAREVRR